MADDDPMETESTGRWEKSLQVKDRQIVLVTTQNETLRNSLSMLENELKAMSDALLVKESVVHEKDRELKKKGDQIKKLLALEDMEKGKEKAIELATQQNAQLLALLEVHEDHTKHLTKERDGLTAKLKDTEGMHSRQIKISAGIEAGLREELQRLHRAHDKLRAEHHALKTQHEGFEELVKKTERDAKAKVQIFEEELVQRRDRQFGALVKVQSLEDQLRATEDEAEARRGQQRVLGERTGELEGRISSLIDALQERDREAEALRLAHAADLARHADEVEGKDEVAGRLGEQVDELSRSLLSVVSKHKELEATLETRSQQIAALKQDLVESRSAEADRESEAVQALRAAERSESKCEALTVDATRLRRELRTTRNVLEAIPRPPPSSLLADDTSEKARVAALRHIVTLAKSSAGAPAAEGAAQASGSTAPSLSGCALAEADMVELADGLAACSALTTLDLSENFLGDRSSPSILSIVSTLPQLRSLDLRRNSFSIEGIRRVAVFLEGAGLRGGAIRHVYVHRDGQIEAIGDPLDGSPSGSKPATLLSIDFRENVSEEVPRAPVGPATPGTQERLDRAESMSSASQRRRRPAKRSNQHSARGEVVASVYGGPGLPVLRR